MELTNYTPVALQGYCKAGGYQAGGKACTTDVTTLSPKEVATLFCRYFQWHVVDGKPDLYGKKHVSAGGKWRQRACSLVVMRCLHA